MQLRAFWTINDYSYMDFLNREVLSRAGMSRVTCWIRERQLRFYGHVVRFPMDDPAHPILNAKDRVEWNNQRGVPLIVVSAVG